MKELKVILWDIEISHNLVAAFSLTHNDYIHPSNIIQEKYLICASWKELGKTKISSVSILDDPERFKKDPFDDYHVLEVLHKVLSEADVIIAHNGDNFDIKVTEARMLIQGFPPLPPIIKIDTLKEAKKRFRFNSNKLDYLGQILKVGEKLKTTPGLWLEVLKGNKSAIKEMVKYNKVDVSLLEKVFLKLRPYIIGVSMTMGDEWACSRCGSDRLHSRGTYKTKHRTYQRYQCLECGGWSKKTNAIDTFPEIRNI